MFHTGYFVREEEMFVKSKNITNLHIIMYISIFDFQLLVGGGGGWRYVYLHIGQIMEASLSY